MMTVTTKNIDDDVSATESHTSPHGASLEVSALNISVRKQDPRPRQQTSYSRKQDRRQQTSETREQKTLFLLLSFCLTQDIFCHS